MSQQPENAYLIPEAMNDNSRYSTPRSSIGGVSTDCEADVESNLSANSEDATPNRRRSSNGIYGIVKAKTALMHHMHLDGKDNDQESSYGWIMMSSAQKIAFASSIVICILFILGFLFLFPGCRTECNKKAARNGENKAAQKWPVELRNVSALTGMILQDINQDGIKEIIMVLARTAEDEAENGMNSSIVVAVDSKSGEVLRHVYIDFQPFWIHCDHVNASCFLVSRSGVIAKINMTSEEVIWSSYPCSDVHSISEVSDIDFDGAPDIIAVCSWQSSEKNIISGIALISGSRGNLLGSKIRYQLSQLPSSFLMQHIDAKNNTCIMFGTQRNGRSTVWAVRLSRLIEIATGARKKVNLVSENPLLVVKNARTSIKPVYYDISNDGVKDLGFVLQEGLIAFIDGATLKLRKTINANQGEIISISILPERNFGRPLLAVLKMGKEKCQNAVFNIYDFRNSFDPYVIEIPQIPVLMRETDPENKKVFIMSLKEKPKTCTKTKKDPQIKLPILPSKQILNLPVLKKKLKESEQILNNDVANEDGINDIDIDAIDKDVLDNLREYVGINDKGVTRHHKLFHLVCNYLLLRFLISYGITTDSVLKDFKSTRDHLLNLSNRNLGHVLTNQLKGLLATDYNRDSYSVPLPDDLDNDIEWLKDVEAKQPIRRNRRDLEPKDWFPLNVNGMEDPNIEDFSGEKWKDQQKIQDPLKKALYSMDDASTETPQSNNNGGNGVVRNSGSTLNHTEDGVDLGLNNGSWLEANLPNEYADCPMPLFKMLEINKMNYNWKDIKVEKGITGKKANGKKVDCNASLEVTDMIVYKHRLYYITKYQINTKQETKVIRLDSIRLNY